MVQGLSRIPYEDGSSLLVGHYLKELGYEVHAIPDPASSQIENHKGLGPVAYLIGWFGYFENFEFNPNSYVIDPWCEIRGTSILPIMRYEFSITVILVQICSVNRRPEL